VAGRRNCARATGRQSGCYPTAALLALLPLASIGAPRQIVVDAKSGITGAGRTPQAGSLFAEVSGEIRAYGLSGHRHQPEMERYLRAGGIGAGVTFTPHVVPISRGMLADAYAVFDEPVDGGAVEAASRMPMRTARSFRVLTGARAPSVAAVVEPTTRRFASTVAGPVVRVICAIDNLARVLPDRPCRTSTSCWDFPKRAD